MLKRFSLLLLFGAMHLLAASFACWSADEAPAETRALVVVDSRLHQLLKPELAAYVKAAESRRGFQITLMPVDGIDDWKPPQVRTAISDWLSSRPKLEGILFVGNVKLPSFFMPRADLPETRLWPRYYEDPDMQAELKIPPGTVLKPVSGPNPTWPFIAGKKEFTVPEHDFDDLRIASPSGPRLWTAYLPVGFADDARNNYENWANQLQPFFKKAQDFYQYPNRYSRGMYIVSNDLGVLDRADSVWSEVGPREIEYYSINEKGKDAFKNNPAGYTRADLSKYGTLKEFVSHARDLPWMDEGWQSPEIFLSHMKTSQRRVVCWNVHSNPELSLLTWQQARDMEGGGLAAVMLGCGVAGYRQPGSASHVDTKTSVDRNVLVNVVYGRSAFVAALGSPFARVRDENGSAFYRTLYKEGSYLGRAHLLRLREGQSSSSQELRQQQEILIGDPFVDARGEEAQGADAPADKPREVSAEGVAYLQRLRKNTPFGTNSFDFKGLRAGMGTRIEPTIKDVKLIPVKVGEIPCEWVLAPGADPDLRLLYLHGGGFVSGSGGRYLPLAAHISAAAKCAVLLPDYRLAPEHPFPAGLDDCVEAHEWLVANGPAGPARAKATFVAGDSAGGSLTLATLLALRDRKLQLPAGGIPLSPCTDFTLASESLKTVADPIISAKTMPIFRDHYLGKTDPRNPLASPVFGDYHGIPPLLIQVGEHEMLRDDSVRVAKKARADGISVKLEVWPGMFHVFQSHEPLLPEAREAVDHIAEFMRSSLPQAAKEKSNP